MASMRRGGGGKGSRKARARREREREITPYRLSGETLPCRMTGVTLHILQGLGLCAEREQEKERVSGFEVRVQSFVF